MAKESEKKGKMSVQEAGHKGGEATAKSHGHEFYEEIGHKGGEKGGQKGGKQVQEEVRRYEEMKGKEGERGH